MGASRRIRTRQNNNNKKGGRVDGCNYVWFMYDIVCSRHWICSKRCMAISQIIGGYMKKGIIILLFSLLAFTQPVKAQTVTAWATAYCPTGNTTATGTIPKEGRTIAGKREWFGKILILFEDKGNGIEPQNYIGTYICEDIGGATISSGAVVDVFIEDLQQAKIFGSKKVIIQIVESEG